MEKLSFAVENVEVIRENPESNFALLEVDFFASGDNLHHLYVSEDTLLRTADTIKNCPLVWAYDKTLDDAWTHDPGEVPCGFVPPTATVTSRKLEDGRTMLSTVAYMWKRYTGPLLSFFKRDKGKKPVSVEMSVLDSQEKDNGETELLDYKYEAITVLGSYVTPAIPSARATVLSFSDLANAYEEDFEKEFSADTFAVPPAVKNTVEKALETHKEHGGGTSVALSFARRLLKNSTMSLEDITNIYNYLSTHENKRGKRNDNDIDRLLWGGLAALEWTSDIIEKSNSSLATFPYKSKKDINPALAGIDPPVSLAQANAIARQADSIGSDEDKNGWAIAISSFKKTHHVEDGKWVKNTDGVGASAEDTNFSDTDKVYPPAQVASIDLQRAQDAVEPDAGIEEFTKEMTMPTKEELQKQAEEEAKKKAEEEETVKMAADETAKEKAEEETAEEKMAADETAKEKAEEETAEEKPVEEKKAKFQLQSMARFFTDDGDADDEDVKMAKEELAKSEEEADFGLVLNALYSKFCKMKEYAKKLEEQNKAYMSENEQVKASWAAQTEELKNFKADIEKRQKDFAVDTTMKELAATVFLPEEVKAELLAEAEKYSLKDIDIWKNYCKAKSFDFAIKQPKASEVVEVGLPFGNVTKKPTDLWA